MISRILASINRSLAFVGKELIESIRRPGALVSLVFGPLLILALFGVGFDGIRKPLETIVVVPATSGLPSDIDSYQQLAGGALHIVQVTPDRAAAESALRAGSVDAVVIAPENAPETFLAGRQSTITLEVDQLDPVAFSQAGAFAGAFAAKANQAIIEQVAREGEGYALAAGGAPTTIPPEVIAAPTTADVVNVAPTQPSIVAFYGPAVLALILQHLAVTMVALSLVRERTIGMVERFRIAPVSAGEILFGKVLAYVAVGLLVGGATLAVLVWGFSEPFLATGLQVAAAILLLLVASVGLGLAIAIVSDSERQTVQLSLLVLLASVFFSGFVIDIHQFIPAVQVIASLLPVTHGIALLQDLLLRGTASAVSVGALLGIAAVTLGGAWFGFRRQLRGA